MKKPKNRISFDSDSNENYGCFQKIKSRKKPRIILMVYDTDGDVILEKEFKNKEKIELKRWL